MYHTIKVCPLSIAFIWTGPRNRLVCFNLIHFLKTVARCIGLGSFFKRLDFVKSYTLHVRHAHAMVNTIRCGFTVAKFPIQRDSLSSVLSLSVAEISNKAFHIQRTTHGNVGARFILSLSAEKHVSIESVEFEMLESWTLQTVSVRHVDAENNASKENNKIPTQKRHCSVRFTWIQIRTRNVNATIDRERKPNGGAKRRYERLRLFMKSVKHKQRMVRYELRPFVLFRSSLVRLLTSNRVVHATMRFG